MELTSTACVASALERHRKFMGDRYIELAVASKEDMLSALEEAVRAE